MVEQPETIDSGYLIDQNRWDLAHYICNFSDPALLSKAQGDLWTKLYLQNCVVTPLTTPYLIYLDHAVYLPHEPEARHEPNCSRK